MNAVMPNDVVQAARAWIGTPFVHQHRALGIGVDCAGLLICVARQLGLVVPEFDVEAYGPRPNGVSLRALCEEHLERSRHPVDGGIVLIAWGCSGPPQHLGVVARMSDGAQSWIHAEGRRQKQVIEQRLVFSRATRLVAAYRFRGVQY